MEGLRSVPQGLDKQEQHALMRAVERERSLRDIALITFMMHTGLRISEIAALDIAYLAKLPKLHPHTLRHTFARNMLNAGEGLEMVAEFLGHKRLDTARVYTKPTDKEKARAVEKLSWRK